MRAFPSPSSAINGTQGLASKTRRYPLGGGESPAPPAVRATLVGVELMLHDDQLTKRNWRSFGLCHVRGQLLVPLARRTDQAMDPGDMVKYLEAVVAIVEVRLAMVLVNSVLRRPRFRFFIGTAVAHPVPV